ncbi:hypothetical protein A9Q84_02640 [Halobacteriovorax marinus]|uniref:Uncharacterized protein n=1 Tax=Halobacteriovorax marinus TaxID=97084 RepID=A0A1Y5FGR1_9BACT|nr:hypothetical protein A9Q84_02640 [Halobacteriovorax marinus]
MNVVKKALIGAAVVATSFSAQAIENTFSFKVFSSGPNIYACNAGIKHIAAGDTLGYNAGNGSTTATTPGTFTKSGFYYGLVQLNEDNNYAYVSGSSETGHRAADGGLKYVVAAGEGFANGLHKIENALGLTAHKAENGNPIALKSLHFELSSELYGAEYFVDICYDGPKENVWGGHYGSVTEVLASANATFTDISARGTNGLKDYKLLSGLKTKVELVCTDGTTQKLEASTGYASIENDAAAYYSDVSIQTEAGNVGPKKCVVRYSFIETNTTKLRINSAHNMQVILNTELTQTFND